jgi:hypothetical protein
MLAWLVFALFGPVLLTAGNQCRLVPPGSQALASVPGIPSPSFSPIPNSTSSGGSNSNQSTPFVYGRDTIRGVNLYVFDYQPSICRIILSLVEGGLYLR